MSTNLIRLLFVPLLAVPLLAQTYDDFNGSKVDRARWFRHGDLAKISQLNGSLRLFGRGFNDQFGVVALRGVTGTATNFAIDLHYHGFKPGDANSAFHVFIYQPSCVAGTGKRVDGDASIGMGSWLDPSRTLVTGFVAEYEALVGGKTITPSTAIQDARSSGVVRIQRTGPKLDLMFLDTTQTPPQFRSILSESAFFQSTDLIFGIGMDTNDSTGMGVDVECDQINVQGTLTPRGKLQTIGDRCLQLGALGLLPQRGQPIDLIALGNRSYRGELVFAGIGLANSRLPNPLPWAGSPGCWLYLNPLLVLAGKMDQYGEWSLSGPCSNTIPAGTVIHAQFAAVTNRNPGGIALSNLVRWEVY